MQVDFRRIKNLIFKNDPQIENELNCSKFKEVIEDSAYTYEDVYTDKDTFIDFLSIGTNGCFIIIPFDGDIDEKWCRDKAMSVRRFFELTAANSFIFFYSNEGSYFYTDKLIPVDDIYVSFKNLYENLLRPLIDVAHISFTTLEELLKEPKVPEAYKDITDIDGEAEYVKPVIPYDDFSDSTVKTVNLIDKIAQTCEQLEGETRPNGKQKVVDGTTYVYKDTDLSLGKDKFSINTGLMAGKSWYPVSEEDPDKILMLTTFGGCFGVHKFYEGRFLEGLLYIFTCGCAGVLPAIDVFLQLAGNGSYYVDEYSGKMRYRQKYFIKRPANMLFGVAGMFIAFGIGLVLINTVYACALNGIMHLATGAAGHLSEDQANSMLQQLTNIFGR